MPDFDLSVHGSTHWLDAMPDAAVIADARGTIVYVNKACSELLGWPPKDLPGQSITRLLPESLDYFNNLEPGGHGSSEPLQNWIALHASGEEVGVEVALRAVGMNGSHYALATMRDNRAHRDEARKLHVLSEAVHAAENGVVITNTSGEIVWVNPAACRITGYTEKQLMGKSTKLLKSGHHDAAFYDQLWKTISAGKVWRGEMINKRKDGSLYHESQTIAPVTDSAGAITHYIAIKQDVSARIHAEEMMRTGYSAIRNAADGIAVVDVEEHLTLVNPAVLTLWGYEREEELVGRNMLDLWQNAEAAQAMMKTLLNECDEWHGELIAKRKDGGELPMRIVAARNRDGEGHVTGMVFSFGDATQRKRSESVMKKAEGQKAMLASLATFCHHMGQPSTVMTTNVAILERLLKDAPEEVRCVLAVTQSACGEMLSILQELQRTNFYRLANYLDKADDCEAIDNKVLEVFGDKDDGASDA